MKAQVKLTKTTIDNTPTWGLYVQRGSHRWLHLPTLGKRGNLKALAARINEEVAQGLRTLDVANRDVWALEDCTCSLCYGKKRAVRMIENDRPVLYDNPCPRCKGKGYETPSDQRRYSAYLAHRMMPG